MPLFLVAANKSPFRRRAAVPAITAGPDVGAAAEPQLALEPLERWTPRFRELLAARRFETLDEELTAIRRGRGPDYDRYGLAYLHARAKIETDELPAARGLLEPFLEPGHPFRDLALHYRAEIAEEEGQAEEAARWREELIFAHPDGTYRSAAIAEQAAWLAENADAARLGVFLIRLAPQVDASTRRQVAARLVDRLLKEGQEAAALERGLGLLRENAADDAADRVFRALDRPELVDRLGASDWVLLGESARSHRHFDRALPLLERALGALPGQREDLLFSIGRAHFGKEDYAAAEKAYAAGAQAADDAESRINFLYHAARAAQLRGDDGAADGYLTRAVAARPAPPPPRRRARRGRRVAPAPPSRASVALTQRLRLRLAAKRLSEAEQDLRLMQRLFRGTEAHRDAVLAYAVALIETGRPAAGLRELEAIRLPADRFVSAEFDYWKGRAWEASQPARALEAYLRVLRAPVPTHFAYLARGRLAQPALAAPLQAELEARRAHAERLMQAADFAAARRVQTDVVLLTPIIEEPEALARLAAIYRELPAYRQFLELQPLPFAQLPLPETAETAPGAEPAGQAGAGGLAGDRLELLLAMGLFDDAIDLVEERYPLAPPAAALTRSLALNLGAAPRSSIRAIELMMSAVPDDYVPQLLPALVRRLLYPRYFYDAIVEEAQRQGADPRLVVAIMREESRFDPRAKSAAAARGLLQLIITTAREVGLKIGLVDLSPEDLYDPRIVIRLGTRYIADLQEEFGGDPYKTAAAYNAGPKQVKLWARAVPGPGPDAFLTNVNFEETKNYVRKVLNSYERYGEIYEGRGRVGGMRAEP